MVQISINRKGKNKMKNGIIYKGPSLLDGKPIVAIATYSDATQKRARSYKLILSGRIYHRSKHRKLVKIFLFVAIANLEEHPQRTPTASNQSKGIAT